MKKRPRIESSVWKSIAAAGLGVLAAVVVAGSLWAPAGAQTQQPEGTIGAKITAIKTCAEKNGITLNSLADLKGLSTTQRAALKQCVKANLSGGLI